MSRDVLRDREEMVFSVSICPGILRCKTLDLGLKKQRELPGYPRFPTQKQRSTGYLCSEQGTAENSRNPRTLRLLYRNKKACEIVGLHRRLKQNGGGCAAEKRGLKLSSKPPETDLNGSTKMCFLVYVVFDYFPPSRQKGCLAVCACVISARTVVAQASHLFTCS